jgi:SAM-dependent methyltransferase
MGEGGDVVARQASGRASDADRVAAELSGEAEQSGVSYNAVFEAVPRSPTLRHIWRAVYGPDYPEEADPYSFVTLTDLRRIAGELGVGPGQTMLDLACGSGGPGLWVARETGASLVGVDFSQVGIEAARQRAVDFGLGERSRFLVCDAAAIDLPDAKLDGAISVDAELFFPDKLRAAKEVARVLRPGGRFVFTTWDFEITPPRWPSQVPDHRDMLREAGFAVEVYEETPDWRRRLLAVYQGWVAAESELVAELGQVVAAGFIREARESPAVFDRSRRVLIVARKP